VIKAFSQGRPYLLQHLIDPDMPPVEQGDGVKHKAGHENKTSKSKDIASRVWKAPILESNSKLMSFSSGI
jgi:hypothetical protein